MTDRSTTQARKAFEDLLEEGRADRNIVGFFLGGSRGKGRETPRSDYDVYVIVRDGVVRPYRKRYRRSQLARIEIFVMSESEFRTYADLDGQDAGSRYDFSHVKALLDRDGSIQRLIEEKGRIPSNRIRSFVSARLDAYLGAVYRSFKYWQDRDSFAARMEAAESIPSLLDAVFAMNGGRVRPYDKYLRWELETFPLRALPMTPTQLQKSIERILATGDPQAQTRLFLAAERGARAAGYGKAFDSWADHRLGSGVTRFRRDHA